MKVILAPTYVPIIDIQQPIFFLAGPVRGGDDWQYNATLLIQQAIPDAVVVIPADYDQYHLLRATTVSGDNKHFSNQLTWERYYLEGAAKHAGRGCIVFWLPRESTNNPRKHGPYARDTYGELGEWRGRMMADPDLRLVIGGESEFPGIDVIKRNFTAALRGSFGTFPFCVSLEETIGAAVKKVI